jgi:DNA-binding NtrC family response regulator
VEVGVSRPELREAIHAGDSFLAAGAYESALERYQFVLQAGADDVVRSLRVQVALKSIDAMLALGRHSDARDSALALLPMIEDAVQFACAQSRLGWASLFLGDLVSAEERCKAAAEGLYPTPEHAELANALRWLGQARLWKGDLERAEESLWEALSAAKRATDRSSQAACYSALGNLHRRHGRFSESVTCHQRALDLNRELGRWREAGKDHRNISLAQFYSGNWAAAREALAEAGRMSGQIGDEPGLTLNLVLESRMGRRCGKPSEAKSAATAALERARCSGFARATTLALEELGDLAIAQGDHELALSNYEEAMTGARLSAPSGDLVCEIAWRLARVHVGAGEVTIAQALAEESVRLAERAGDCREEGSGVATLAMIASAKGKTDEARHLFVRAVTIFRQIGAPYELAETHELAAAHVSGAGLIEPLGHLLEALSLYGRMGCEAACARVTKDVRRLEKRLASGFIAEPEAHEPTTVLLTADPILEKLISTARDLAPDTSTILLQGETGTGKELVARIIHEAGARPAEPFVPVNCGALPQQLLESELFGHRKGAFTGAERDRTGVLESAGDGTVFLDEIDKASPDLQVRLLRVIEDRQVRPVGSDRFRPFRARIVCASNRDLKELADRGTFLLDLYYRLSAFCLTLPPLRTRKADVALLAKHFLEQFGGRFGQESYELSPEAEAKLVSYDWPGNVRELRNVMEASAFYARETGLVTPAELPKDVRFPQRADDDSLAGRIEELQRREILAAMEKANGIKTEAAKILGCSRKGLRERMRRLGLED